MTDSYRRMGWSVGIVLLVAVLATGIVDETGRQHAERAFTRALVTFAVARTLNGVISVAQGTEVAVEPGGVGVNFSVGQILDPVNDLVERFSTVMLFAASSLGLQNVLLAMTSWWGVSGVLLSAAIFALLALWWPRLAPVRGVALRVLLVMVFIRFALPVLVVGSNVMFDVFLEAEQAAATEALDTTRSDIEALNRPAAAADSRDDSLVDRLGTFLDDSLEALDVRQRLDQLRQRVSGATEHIINLIVVFILQTVVFPLAFLWLFGGLIRRLAARSIST